MNRRNVFLTLFLMSILFIGCSNTSGENLNNQSAKLKLLSDSLNQCLKIQELLTHGVDSLKGELNLATEEIETLKSTADNGGKKSQSLVWTILPIAIGCIALIAFIVDLLTRSYVKEDDLENKIKSYLKNDRSKKEEDEFNTTQRSTSSQLRNNSFVEKEIRDLKNQMDGMSKTIEDLKQTIARNNQQGATPSCSSNAKETGQTHPKRLYAKSISNSCLTEIVETKEETCAIVIELTDDNHGEFDIASFNQVKQSNSLESFVDYDGDCTIDEANSCKSTQKGTCEKLKPGVWKVVNKLKITILK